jgi:hypothetical protein
MRRRFIMCALREDLLINNAGRGIVETLQKTELKLAERIERAVKIFGESPLWCRDCKEKTPMAKTRSCDCGVIMCGECWDKWDVICPICDNPV